MTNLKTLSAILVLAFMTAPAVGQTPDYVQFTVTSTHYVSGDYNEQNPGVLVGFGVYESESFEASVLAGGYKNSFANPALVTGARASWVASDYVQVNMTIGGVTGYAKHIPQLSAYGVTAMTSQSVEIGPEEMRLTVYHLVGAVGVGGTMNF